jgi:hypothetical protein
MSFLHASSKRLDATYQAEGAKREMRNNENWLVHAGSLFHEEQQLLLPSRFYNEFTTAPPSFNLRHPRFYPRRGSFRVLLRLFAWSSNDSKRNICMEAVSSCRFTIQLQLQLCPKRRPLKLCCMFYFISYSFTKNNNFGFPHLR